MPLLGALIAVGVLSGCEENIEVRGNLPDPKAIAEIKAGKTNRAEVEDLLGPPTAVATFQKEIWYYIGGKVKTVSFFEPELLNRQIITIRFNKKGTVEAINDRRSTSDTDVKLVSRVTPTRGKKLTVLQQLIGNIGRFGGEQDKKGNE